MLKLCFLVALSALHLTKANKADSLRLVNLVYRHGDRSPIDIFPTDPNKIDKWPQGLGWLSKTGMRQHYALGQWLKERYIDTGFMSDAYKHTEIQVESSDEDRCLMSAYSNLAGLYPPGDDQMFNPNIHWQPIAVHTRPTYEDNMLNMGKKCPRYDDLLKQTMKSHAVQEEERRNKYFYQWIGQQTKWNHENISNIWRIADTLYCENAHNFTLAKWTQTVNETWGNITAYDKLRQLEALQFTLLFNGTEMNMLKGGPLLSQYIANMRLKIETNLTTKMFMYSGHDTTVAALLSALGVYNGLSPHYASTVIAELHEEPQGHFYVNLLYKNDTYSNATVEITLPKCGFNCTFDKFADITRISVPKNWDAACGFPAPGQTGSKSTLATGWIVSIVLGCLLLVLIVTMLVCFVRHRKKSDHFLYGKFDVST